MQVCFERGLEEYNLLPEPTGGISSSFSNCERETVSLTASRLTPRAVLLHRARRVKQAAGRLAR